MKARKSPLAQAMQDAGVNLTKVALEGKPIRFNGRVLKPVLQDPHARGSQAGAKAGREER